MKKVYLVPNLITTVNIFFGFYAVIASIQGEFLLAAWCIIAASIFDALDGRIARLTQSTSQFGLEYDSLSDLVSFGVAPGVLLYQWAFQDFPRFGWLSAFLFLICGAFRLARFNSNTELISKNFFQGLPIPIAALTIAAYIIFIQDYLFLIYQEEFALGMTFILAFLMISNISFPSYKKVNWKSKMIFGYYFLGLVSIILWIFYPMMVLFFLAACYIVLSLLWNLFQLNCFKLKKIKK